MASCLLTQRSMQCWSATSGTTASHMVFCSSGLASSTCTALLTGDCSCFSLLCTALLRGYLLMHAACMQSFTRPACAHLLGLPGINMSYIVPFSVTLVLRADALQCSLTSVKVHILYNSQLQLQWCSNIAEQKAATTVLLSYFPQQ